MITTKGADDAGLELGVLDIFEQRQTENGVRADFDEEAVSIDEELVAGGREAHGLTQVSVPVRCAELGAVDDGAGDGGVDGQLGRAGRDVLELREDVVTDGLDVHGVRGVIDEYLPDEDLLFGELVDQRLDGVAVARHEHCVWGIDRGDGDAALPRRKIWLECSCAELNGGHGSEACDLAES